jgi:acyl transferase domain-containing protein/acyl carrier protein
MKKTLYLYSGEGTSNSESAFKLIEHSRIWPEIISILDSKFDLNFEEIWKNEIGKHRCPYSPLLTVVTQICLSDILTQWGYRPDVVIGHSVGELSASYQAGFYSLEDILKLTLQIGQTASNLQGVMLHGELSDHQIDELSVNLSSLNFKKGDRKHVTLSGYPDEMGKFVDQNPGFVTMRLPHPWHHPDYRKFSDKLKPVQSNRIEDFRFVSGVTANFETQLNSNHWQNWLAHPVDFISAMQAIRDRYEDDQLEIIEIGFHPVLDQCCDIFDDYQYISTMFRGEDEIQWILHQRKKLDQKLLLEKIKTSIEKFRPGLDFKTSLAYQGFTSLKFAEFSEILQIYFPSLAPQDFYRYKTINQLIEHFGSERPDEEVLNLRPYKNEVVISAMSCKFPSAVENLPQFWKSLLSGEDQVKANASRGGFEAGFLSDNITRFDHKFFNISEAEARTMDPQQILALELTELLFRDAGLDPAGLDKKRIGVYIGVWNQEYRGDRQSVYYPTGTNPSIIASRISYHYDLRGPSWVSNTACSSSLVAVHYASKDIEDGRIDYAIAGGVNMILGDDFTDKMRSAGFLSKDDRCKVFDNSANGYVRAEGGGLGLLANKKLVKKYYAELKGSSINQNGGRSQVITAPHPEAQEELILDACQDAGIKPQDISYMECHGTGTKIGDPIEISALQKTVAKGRKGECLLGSVKSNIGHLESAAGIAGLIKSVLILNHGVIPPNLHYNQPNDYIDFKSHNLKVVSSETKIDNQIHIGISSFGFGGSNAHIILKGVDAGVRKAIEDIKIPFDRGRSALLKDYYQLNNIEFQLAVKESGSIPERRIEVAHVDAEVPAGNGINSKLTREDVQRLVQELFFKVTNIETIDSDVELIEQGLDSLSVTEFISQLQSSLGIEIDPDLIFEHPLPDQLIDEIHALI